MQKAVIHLETLSCPSCLQKIEKAVKGLSGIEKNSVEVLFNSSRVRTNFDANTVTIEEIEQAIKTMGYPVLRSRVKAA
ncbi:MAG TPA: heavy-metal-associated domain-containing protein [Pseudogracilibacillus sp.]|nr:heavy-metal-associated domain-containing protein [Pseudogracilibacillus sp.]